MAFLSINGNGTKPVKNGQDRECKTLDYMETNTYTLIRRLLNPNMGSKRCDLEVDLD